MSTSSDPRTISTPVTLRTDGGPTVPAATVKGTASRREKVVENVKVVATTAAEVAGTVAEFTEAVPYLGAVSTALTALMTALEEVEQCKEDCRATIKDAEATEQLLQKFQTRFNELDNDKREELRRPLLDLQSIEWISAVSECLETLKTLKIDSRRWIDRARLFLKRSTLQGSVKDCQRAMDRAGNLFVKGMLLEIWYRDQGTTNSQLGVNPQGPLPAMSKMGKFIDLTLGALDDYAGTIETLGIVCIFPEGLDESETLQLNGTLDRHLPFVEAIERLQIHSLLHTVDQGAPRKAPIIRVLSPIRHYVLALRSVSEDLYDALGDEVHCLHDAYAYLLAGFSRGGRCRKRALQIVTSQSYLLPDIESATQAVQAASAEGSVPAVLLLRLGSLYTRNAHYEAAHDYISQAIKLDAQLGDWMGLVTDYNELAQSYLSEFQSGDWPERSCLDQAQDAIWNAWNILHEQRSQEPYMLSARLELTQQSIDEKRSKQNMPIADISFPLPDIGGTSTGMSMLALTSAQPIRLPGASSALVTHGSGMAGVQASAKEPDVRATSLPVHRKLQIDYDSDSGALRRDGGYSLNNRTEVTVLRAAFGPRAGSHPRHAAPLFTPLVPLSTRPSSGVLTSVDDPVVDWVRRVDHARELDKSSICSKSILQRVAEPRATQDKHEEHLLAASATEHVATRVPTIDSREVVVDPHSGRTPLRPSTSPYGSATLTQNTRRALQIWDRMMEESKAAHRGHETELKANGGGVMRDNGTRIDRGAQHRSQVR
ncbi:hypothetical protein PENSPDRAFT_738524 [Peniophora sp. CONT]|nr:hypothetical protein PENSPDRAFT_738524 [Peniophora sp. CONT]